MRVVRRRADAPPTRPARHARRGAPFCERGRAARLRQPVGAGAPLLRARAVGAVRRPPGHARARGVPHDVVAARAADRGSGVDRTRRARHRHPRRRLPPPGRARPAAGDARPPVGRSADRRPQRRLVEGRARPDGRRLRQPRSSHGRARRGAAGLLGTRPGGVRRRVLPHPAVDRQPQATAAAASTAAVGHAVRRRPPANGGAVRHLEPGVGIDRADRRDRRPRSTPCDQPGTPPIEVVQRIFTEPPFVVPGLGAAVSRSDGRLGAPPPGDAGFAHVVVDTGFTTEVTSPDDWATFPDRLAPLLTWRRARAIERRPAPTRRRSRGSSATRRPRRRPDWRRSRRGRGSRRRGTPSRRVVIS